MAPVLPRKTAILPAMSPRDRPLVLWTVLKGLPPVAPARLLMAAVFLGGWSLLRLAGTATPTAFVWAAVLAQAAQVWSVLPITARRPLAVGQTSRALTWGMAAILGLLALQLWWADPRLTQRLLSAFCALYAAIMGFTARSASAPLILTVTGPGATDIPPAFRRRLLHLYAGLALLVLAVNEGLLALDAGLGTRVAILALLPVALHYLFHLALDLSFPRAGPGQG